MWARLQERGHGAFGERKSFHVTGTVFRGIKDLILQMSLKRMVGTRDGKF